jgi:hypothetical protein
MHGIALARPLLRMGDGISEFSEEIPHRIRIRHSTIEQE